MQGGEGPTRRGASSTSCSEPSRISRPLHRLRQGHRRARRRPTDREGRPHHPHPRHRELSSGPPSVASLPCGEKETSRRARGGDDASPRRCRPHMLDPYQPELRGIRRAQPRIPFTLAMREMQTRKSAVALAGEVRPLDACGGEAALVASVEQRLHRTVFAAADTADIAFVVACDADGALPPGQVAIVFLAQAEVLDDPNAARCPTGTVPAVNVDPIRHGTARHGTAPRTRRRST